MPTASWAVQDGKEWGGDKTARWPHPRPRDTLPLLFFSPSIQSSHLPMASQVELVEDKSMGVSIRTSVILWVSEVPGASFPRVTTAPWPSLG